MFLEHLENLIFRESRYLDIFTDICEELDYNAKSACYLITNEYDDQLREWFNERREEGFLESFCFKELTECNKKVVEASMTDIELENYEEDKHLIDDDFMPEAKEENVKKDEKSNFMSQAIEKLLNIRDNALDLAEEIDQNVKKMITKEVLENPRIRQQTDKILKVEHYELFLKHWWLAVISILISFMLPIIFVISLQKRISADSNGAKSPRGSSKSTKKSTTSASKLKVPAVSIETSESEAAEADDEKSVLSSRKSSRSSRILASTSNKNTASPVKKITKRNSKSQSDD